VWVRISDPIEFDTQWGKIEKIAPASVVEYLRMEWLGDRDLWSVVEQTGHSMKELGDANMLVEAYIPFQK
jgi:hypothetical protein